MHIYIVGCKGIPAAYGGYETFADALVSGQQNEEIQYHVACATEQTDGNPTVFSYQKAECFRIRYRRLGAARAIFYDLDAIRWVLFDVKRRRLEDQNLSFAVYILACRIGPFFHSCVKKLHRLGGAVMINPDGHEWKRAKWSAPVRRYWKFSESLMVKHADLVICDSKNIESYIRREYAKTEPKTCYLSYGASLPQPENAQQRECYDAWCAAHQIHPEEYYLVVGRFVPENNYEVILREFGRSHTPKKLVIVTNQEASAYYERLRRETRFSADPRICFVGTVYERPLLESIRMHAYAYLHGHSVGGTNPSLLEALAATEVNLLYEVGFNREVAEEAALYWNKEPGCLAALIDGTDAMPEEERKRLGALAKERIREHYTWDRIIGEYEKLFTRK